MAPASELTREGTSRHQNRIERNLKGRKGREDVTENRQSTDFLERVHPDIVLQQNGANAHAASPIP